ncbi:MAG: phosphotransferase [Blastococcus sp.]
MTAPGDPVAAARDRVVALLAELGVTQPLVAVGDHTARLGVVQGVLADRVLDVAVTESGRLRIHAELRGRRWAAERGVGAPAALAAADDGRWLLSRRVHLGGTRGERWSDEAIEAAVRIAPLPAPPGEPWDPPPPGRAGRARTSVQDASRLVRGGVRIGELRAVQAAARKLPLSEVVHGDFRAANVVLDEEADRLVVLEWAGVRAGPRHRDLLTLWATTPDDEHREGIAEVVLERTPRWEWPDVGLRWHAVALEQLVERLTRPDRGDRLGAGFARSRLAEARRMAARLGSPVNPRP